MSTLTEVVAAVVIHSSTAAFSHFGVTLEAPRSEQHAPAPADPRVVARTRPGTERLPPAVTRPDARQAPPAKA